MNFTEREMTFLPLKIAPAKNNIWYFIGFLFVVCVFGTILNYFL